MAGVLFGIRILALQITSIEDLLLQNPGLLH